MEELPIAKVAEPETAILAVSPKAAEVFAAGLTERGAKAVLVAQEVGVDGRARMRLAMAKEPREGDVIVVERGVTFYLDPETAKTVRGAMIEYEDSEDGGRFLIGMPHRHDGGGCGCGGSHGGNSGGGCACGGNHGQGGQAGGHDGGGGCACGREH